MLIAGLLIAVASIFALIVGHELAHLVAARALGIEVEEFGFGLPLGPRLKIGTFGGTEFVFRLIPFGAYMVAPGLEAKGNLTRSVAVLVAGLAFYVVAAWCVLVVGYSIFGVPQQLVVVDRLTESNPIAKKAGIQKGDVILSIDSTKILSTSDVTGYLSERPGKQVSIVVVHQNDQQATVVLTPNEEGKVGMALDTIPTHHAEKIAPAAAIAQTNRFLVHSAKELVRTIGWWLGAIKLQIPIPFGGLLLMGEFIAAFSTATCEVVAVIALDMLLLTLIPWPGTDMGHLVAMILNTVRGKKPENKAIRILHKIGLVMITLNSLPPCIFRNAKPTPEADKSG